jgi:hypothetical protein
MSGAIRLLATGDDDLQIVSACLQDAILPIGEMGFLPDEERFVMVVNRFKWEAVGRAAASPGPGPVADDAVGEDGEPLPYERTHCAVRFEGVTAVKRRGIDLRNRGEMLELLSVVTVVGGVIIHFAGGGGLLLRSDAWRCTVEDLGDPWPTGNLPQHPVED